MIIFEPPVVDGTKDRLNIRSLFPCSDKPLKVEIGFGNGVFILNRAQTEPHVNFVGVELYHKGIRSLARQVKNINLNNLIIIYAEAKTLFTNSIQDNDLEELYVNFPDPWPKKKHKKRRLLNADFAHLVYTKLRNKARVSLATDSEDYAKEILVSFDGVPGYRNTAGRLKFADKTYDNTITKYEQKFTSYEKKIYYLHYQVQK